jgi:hypothetical protein
VTGDFGTVSGGFANTADFAATVGGGHNNTAGGADSTVGGGLDNTAESGTAGTVGGGDLNKVQNHYATVSGGTRNIASGPGAVVGGGGFDGLNLGGNVASGGASVVPGDTITWRLELTVSLPDSAPKPFTTAHLSGPIHKRRIFPPRPTMNSASAPKTECALQPTKAFI